MSSGDAQQRWANSIVAALAQAGVTDAIVSPGSRSTPLVFALLASDLSVDWAIDERGAAFLALGQARVTGVPVALVCTSGTAGAHYLPAVIEAFESGVPLVLLTADRPPSLHDIGASQTTNQRAFYGSHCAVSTDLGPFGEGEAALRSVASRVARAVAAAKEAPGPVHINVPLQKPLEPESFPSFEPPLGAGPQTALSRRVASPTGIAAAAEAVARSPRCVIVVGPQPVHDAQMGEAIRRLAAVTGAPLLADVCSQLRDGRPIDAAGRAFARFDAFDLALRAPKVAAAFDKCAVVQLGPSPTSASLMSALARRRGAAPWIVVCASGWHDSEHAATHVIQGSVAETVDSLATMLAELSTPDTAFGAALDTVSRTIGGVLDRELGAFDDAPTGATVARATVAATPSDGLLVVGNSLPVRDLEAFCPALPRGLGVVSQRGVAGIDGMVAGAIGASRGSGRAVTALIGDVTFVHDIGSLALSRLAKSSVVVVVVNNGGGRIFDRLPVARLWKGDAAEHAAAMWRTPPALDLVSIAGGFGLEAVRVNSITELGRAVTEAHERGSVSVVQVDLLDDADARDEAIVALVAESAAVAFAQARL